MGTLVQHHLTPADRYLRTLLRFNGNGWTFTWINTARGMTHVCQRWGGSPHAFVVLRHGARATEEELKLHVRNAIAHIKTPQWISLVDQLPKTATGKVQKYILRVGKAAISQQ